MLCAETLGIDSVKPCINLSRLESIPRVSTHTEYELDLDLEGAADADWKA